MTVLVWFCIIMAAAITLIMTVKLALEVYCRWYKPLGKDLENFRRRYWIHLGSTIVRVVLVLYGLGVLYCCFQFKQNDSWAATVLAAITLALMTLTLLALTARIFFLALYASREKGGLEYLFSHKPWIRKYGLFTTSFKSSTGGVLWYLLPPVLAETPSWLLDTATAWCRWSASW